MVHKGDLKVLAQMLRNIEKVQGKIEFKAPLIVTAPTYNIIDELKNEGDWKVSAKEILALNLMTRIPKLLLVGNIKT